MLAPATEEVSSTTEEEEPSFQQNNIIDLVNQAYYGDRHLTREEYDKVQDQIQRTFSQNYVVNLCQCKQHSSLAIGNDTSIDIVDSGGCRDIESDSSKFLSLKELKTRVWFGFYNGGTTATHVGLKERFIYNSKRDVHFVDMSVSFLLPQQPGSSSPKVSIFSTGQSKLRGIGFHQIPSRPDVLAAYGDGEEDIHTVLGNFLQAPSSWRSTRCNNQRNGLPNLKPADPRIARSSGKPLISWASGKRWTSDERSYQSKRAVSAFHKSYEEEDNSWPYETWTDDMELCFASA